MSLAHPHEASYETLYAEFERNAKRIEALQARQEELQLRMQALAPTPPARAYNTPEAVRDAIVDMRTFTLAELSARLGCSKPTARRHIEEWLQAERLRAAGKFGKQPMFEYVAPQGPGAGFEQQQKLRKDNEAPEVAYRSELAAGAGTGVGSLVNQVQYKDVRDACKEAMAQGWTLERKGNSHFVLIRGKVRVGVPSTPKNASAAARRIRNEVARGHSPRRHLQPA